MFDEFFIPTCWVVSFAGDYRCKNNKPPTHLVLTRESIPFYGLCFQLFKWNLNNRWSTMASVSHGACFYTHPLDIYMIIISKSKKTCDVRLPERHQFPFAASRGKVCELEQNLSDFNDAMKLAKEQEISQQRDLAGLHMNSVTCNIRV